MKTSILQLLSFCLFIISYSITGFAETLSLKLPNNFTSTAEYVIGDKTKTAVLILHGLLQTRNYLTVQSLISAIGDDGYTVLAPNLSFGISNRKKSLPCEAIHNHNMLQDIEEIDYWVKFLENKGYSSIYLVGHSYGSLQILIYANKKKPQSVKKLITTSLINVEKTNDGRLMETFLNQARQHIKNNDSQLHEYSLSYCKKYIAPAKDFLSYAMWNRNKLIAEINKLNIPISIIVGSEDTRIDTKWKSLLRKAKSKLIIIEGANHFFDTTHEFDMNDKVLNELSIL
jgi:esterase/lipase